MIARLGGDEFVVLMNGSGQTGTVRPLAAIAKSLSERGENGVFPVSYSMGTCIFDPERHDSVHAMLDEADGAMYSVKRGRQAS